MKRITFTLGLAILSIFNLKAQVSFSKVGSYSYGEFEIHRNYTSNGIVFYAMEIVNETNLKFIILNNDFTENRSFIIENCVWEGGIMLTEIEPKGDYADYCYLTQTLFNDDDKFEVLRIVLKEINTEWGSDFEITGVEIVSEDGTVLGELPTELRTTYLSAFNLDNNNYLGKWIEDDEDNLYHIYAINGNGSNNISFREVKSRFAYPNPIGSSKEFTIQLEENISGTNTYVEITDVNGRTLDRQRISDKEDIRVSTRKLRKGQYLYNVISDNKNIDSGKIIVQ